MLGPLGRHWCLIVRDPLPKCALLRDVFEQLLIVNGPSQLPRGPVGNRAAVRAGFAAHGNGERRWDGWCRRPWGAVALVAMTRRLIARSAAGRLMLETGPLFRHGDPLLCPGDALITSGLGIPS